MFYSIVKSQANFYGILAVVCDQNTVTGYGISIEQKLRFLAELSAVVLERCRLEKVADRLMLVAEQNRIADEIHDSVSQRLFSIVCGSYALAARCDTLSREEIKENLQLIRANAHSAAQELRSSILRLSSRKRGESTLKTSMAAYLDDLARLNGIKVVFKASLEEENLGWELEKSLYRIIREATGNAIRHGRCSWLEVILNTTPEGLNLEIRDDGKGFDINTIGKTGLGLKNMKSLVRSHNGNLAIKSRKGKGTIVECFIPLDSKPVREGDGEQVESGLS